MWLKLHFWIGLLLHELLMNFIIIVIYPVYGAKGDVIALFFFFLTYNFAGGVIAETCIGHFRVFLCLCFKTILSAKPFIWIWVLYANQSHFHKKGFALRLALKQRHSGTRKWSIALVNRPEFDLRENETARRTRFHMKGLALKLVLKQRHKRTWKWPIWNCELLKTCSFYDLWIQLSPTVVCSSYFFCLDANGTLQIMAVFLCTHFINQKNYQSRYVASNTFFSIHEGRGKWREGCFDVAQHGLSANISVTFQATLNLYTYFSKHCLAVLRKFLGDFLTFWGRDFFFKE